MRPEPKPEEVAAGQLLAHLLDGVVTLDAGDVPGRHDLDVVLADGTVVAVEVTTHAVDYTKQTQGEVNKRAWDYPELTRHWWLSMEQPTVITWTRDGLAPGFDVPALHELLPGPLERLEALGVESIGPHSLDVPPAVRAAFEPLRAVGVRFASSAPAGHGNVLPLLGAVGFFTGADVGADIANEHLKRKASVLHRASDADERHLFVWIDYDYTPHVDAIHNGPVPVAEPDIPENVDAVWLASMWGPSPRVVRYRAVAGWDDFGQVDWQPRAHAI